MILSLWHYLSGASPTGEFIANWSQDRVKQYEQATAKYEGRMYETYYGWSKEFRPVTRTLRIAQQRRSA